jgi:hypothetical protein
MTPRPALDLYGQDITEEVLCLQPNCPEERLSRVRPLSLLKGR